jgi:hypothetical protein
MRSVTAILLAILAGAFVYDWLASGGTGLASSAALLLPAMLIGVMVVALVFLPLWSVLVHRTRRIRAAFLCTGVAILVLICGGLAALGAFDRAGGLESFALLFVPGLVLVTTFAILMDRRRVRGGQKPESDQG